MGSLPQSFYDCKWEIDKIHKNVLITHDPEIPLDVFYMQRFINRSSNCFMCRRGTLDRLSTNLLDYSPVYIECDINIEDMIETVKELSILEDQWDDYLKIKQCRDDVV